MSEKSERVLRMTFLSLLMRVNVCEFKCLSAKETIEYVRSCPSTHTGWEEAAKRKNCSSIKQSGECKQKVYHCLLNEFRNTTLEVCATPWYLQGYCAVFDMFENKIKDDRKRDCVKFHTNPCPTRFISTESYKYIECYKILSSSSSTYSTLVSTDKPTPESILPKNDSKSKPVEIVAVTGTVFFVALLSILFLFVIHKRKGKIKRNGQARNTNTDDKKQGEDNEDTNLLQQNETTRNNVVRNINENIAKDNIEKSGTQEDFEMNSEEIKKSLNSPDIHQADCGKDGESTLPTLQEERAEQKDNLETHHTTPSKEKKLQTDIIEGCVNEEVNKDKKTEETDIEVKDGETSLNSSTTVFSWKDSESTVSTLQQERAEQKDNLETHHTILSKEKKLQTDIRCINEEVINDKKTERTESNHKFEVNDGETQKSNPLSTTVSNNESTVFPMKYENRDMEDKSHTHSSTSTNETNMPIYLLRLHEGSLFNPGQVSVTKKDDSSLRNYTTGLDQPPKEIEDFISIRRSKNYAKGIQTVGQTVSMHQDGAPHYTDVPPKPQKSRDLMMDIRLNLETIDEKLKDLRSDENGLEGQVGFLQQTMDCLEHCVCELEKDCNISKRRTVSEERGNLDKRVRWLYERYLNLDHRRMVVEIHLVTGIKPDQQHCDKDDNPDRNNIETEPVINVIKMLEEDLRKLEEILSDLQQKRFGEKGSIEVLKSKIKYQEVEVVKLEEEYGLSEKPIADMKSDNKYDQLLKMEDASRNLISRLEILGKK